MSFTSSGSSRYEKFSGWPKPVFVAETTSGSELYKEKEGPEPDPLVSEPKPKTRLPWSTGLFHCFSDWRICCMTCWCPCVTFGRIAEIVDKGSSSCGVNGALYTVLACVTGCACCYSCFYRTKMRQQQMLKESPCSDCCIHFFCEYCALCQEYRELSSRGYDLPIGWHGNLEKRTREIAMSPVVDEPPMTRS